jgi:transcriptional regulator with XRE-family HTH domain
MYLAARIRDLREAKGLSQGDVEQLTGLLRCYISRVENGHTVPALETLEKFARAMEVPLYQLLYTGEQTEEIHVHQRNHKRDWASFGRGARYFSRMRQALARMSAQDRALLLFTASKMASRNK